MGHGINQDSNAVRETNVTYADEMRIVYSCATVGAVHNGSQEVGDGHLNYYTRCGQRFNWKVVETG